MKIQSAKQKGRRACVEFRDLIVSYLPNLKTNDIQVMPTSVTGEDLKLSPLAWLEFPFAVECKNTEKLNIWQAYAQAESHIKNENDLRTPLLAFTRNRSPLMICVEAEVFLTIYAELRKLQTEANALKVQKQISVDEPTSV